MFKVCWDSSLETTLADDDGARSTGAGRGTIEGTAGDGGVGSTGAGGGTIEGTTGDGGVGSTGAGRGTIEDTACDGGVGSNNFPLLPPWPTQHQSRSPHVIASLVHGRGARKSLGMSPCTLLSSIIDRRDWVQIM